MAYLNDCSLVRSFEEGILGRGRRADQKGAAAGLNVPRLCLYSAMLHVIKSRGGVEEG